MLSHSFSRRSPGSMLNPMIILPQKIDVLKRSFLFLMNRILRFFLFSTFLQEGGDRRVHLLKLQDLLLEKNIKEKKTCQRKSCIA